MEKTPLTVHNKLMDLANKMADWSIENVDKEPETVFKMIDSIIQILKS